MLKITVENERKETIEITDERMFKTTVAGLVPVTAVINTSAAGNTDGSQLNSTRLDNRNIVITAVIISEVEKNRLKLYQIFQTKRKVTIHIDSGTRQVYIEGTVETFELDQYENPQKAQISIICTNPHLKSEEESVIESTVTEKLFEFPFSIPEEGEEFSTISALDILNVKNAGEIETGMIMEFYATGGDVTNPVVYSEKTHGKIGFQCVLHEGERIIVNTEKWEKEVTKVSGGKREKFINELMKPAEWFQLDVGENLFTVYADDGVNNLNVLFHSRVKYQGV